jgi:hypothetical protein
MRPKYLSQDLKQRLEGGVIFYNDTPHFVSRANSSNSKPLTLVPLIDMNSSGFTVKLDDERLDISSRPLGYVNHRGRAYYLIRNPSRRYKQSMCIASLSMFCPDQNSFIYDGGSGETRGTGSTSYVYWQLPDSGYCC